MPPSMGESVTAGATVAVARCHKGGGEIIAEERDVGRVHRVADRERAAQIVAIGRIAEKALHCGLWAAICIPQLR